MTTEPQTSSPAEQAWTSEQLQRIRTVLEGDLLRVRVELGMLEHDVTMSAASDLPADELDSAALYSELDQDVVRAENGQAIIEQIERVIGRVDAGLYGTCELCDGVIGRDRLSAFPRATTCINCARRTSR